MKKYEVLAEKYASQIARIRHLKSLMDEATAKVRDHEKSQVNWQDDEAVADWQRKGEDVYRAWQEADDNYKIECERLSQDIEAEYWDVPFAEPRKQGIARFWEIVRGK